MRERGLLLGACGLAVVVACSTKDEPTNVPSVIDDAGLADASPIERDASAPQDAAVDGAVDPCKPGLDGLPDDLACTGLYSAGSTSVLAAGVEPYVPGAPFWSDGAEKNRYLYLPPNAKIDTTQMNAWSWPVGTRAWKEFSLGGKRLETRIFAKVEATRWAFTSYVWNAEGTKATRLDAGTRLPAFDDYEVPPAAACANCHAGAGDKLLGLDPVALSLPTATGITLTSLAQAGRLTAPPAKLVGAVPEDATGKAAAALRYLHGNCGSCHNDSPNAPAFISPLRLLLTPDEVLSDTPKPTAALAAYATAYCKTSTYGKVGAATFMKYIAGGSKNDSALYFRPSVRNPRDQMPPIGSHKVDTVGIELIGAWVNALPVCP